MRTRAVFVGVVIGITLVTAIHATSAASGSSVDRRTSTFSLPAQPTASPSPDPGPKPYRIFPQAGTLWRDIFVGNFVDLDPGPGEVLDWNCGAQTKDRHTGWDSQILGFQEQAIGVPVFAALDGMVLSVNDDADDMNTDGKPHPTNVVVIAHGGTHRSSYHHLKKGSVDVEPGQFVRAGTQIGLTGSSGQSTWPHLHFESRYKGAPYEPAIGPCNQGTTPGTNQLSLPQKPVVRSIVLSPNPFTGDAALPWDEAVRTGTYVKGTKGFYVRVQLGAVPARSSVRLQLIGPDQSVRLDLEREFGNSEALAAPHYSWRLDADLDQLGTWKVRLDVNDVTRVTAPFRVVSDAAKVKNRPPRPIAVQLEPPAPTRNDVVFCRVTAPVLVRDADYDLVRYGYEWRVNGEIVRDTVSAALSDALPAGTVAPGDAIACRVTPKDGKVDGPTASALVGPSHALSVSVSGPGGRVTSTPGGISCPSACSSAYEDGTSVRLTATPAARWQFEGWSGACTGQQPECDLVMTEDRTVRATFSRGAASRKT